MHLILQYDLLSHLDLFLRIQILCRLTDVDLRRLLCRLLLSLKINIEPVAIRLLKIDLLKYLGVVDLEHVVLTLGDGHELLHLELSLLLPLQPILVVEVLVLLPEHRLLQLVLQRVNVRLDAGEFGVGGADQEGGAVHLRENRLYF